MLSNGFSRRQNHSVLRTEHLDFQHLHFISSTRNSFNGTFQMEKLQIMTEPTLALRKTRNTQVLGKKLTKLKHHSFTSYKILSESTKELKRN